MLKASLFTLICGMIAAHIPAFLAFPALMILPALEILYIALHHGHAVHHFGGGLAVLFMIGVSGFYLTTCYRLHSQLASAER